MVTFAVVVLVALRLSGAWRVWAPAIGLAAGGLTGGVTGLPNEAEMPLRLLRHYATSVRHQQYHDTDIVTFRMEPRGSGWRTKS